MSQEPWTEHQIHLLALRIRTAFMDEKKRVLGGSKKFRPRPELDNIEFFRKAARQCAELGADPHDYVMAAIEGCQVKGGPFANQLGGVASRGWYKMYCSRLGVEPSVTYKTNDKGEKVEEIVYACDIDLKMDMSIIYSTFLHNSNGNTDPTFPNNLRILRDPFYTLPAHARILVGCFDAEVLRTFGPEAYDFFTTRRQYIQAARNMKLPIDEMLLWINNQVLLK